MHLASGLTSPLPAPKLDGVKPTFPQFLQVVIVHFDLPVYSVTFDTNSRVDNKVI